jgi:hypothetical protein
MAVEREVGFPKKHTGTIAYQIGNSGRESKPKPAKKRRFIEFLIEEGDHEEGRMSPIDYCIL